MKGVIYKKNTSPKEFQFPCEGIWSLREIGLNQIVVIYRKEFAKKDHIIVWDGISEVREFDHQPSEIVRVVECEGK